MATLSLLGHEGGGEGSGAPSFFLPGIMRFNGVACFFFPRKSRRRRRRPTTPFPNIIKPGIGVISGLHGESTEQKREGTLHAACLRSAFRVIAASLSVCDGYIFLLTFAASMGIAFSNGEGKETAVRRYSPLSGIGVQAYTLDRFHHFIIRNHATWERSDWP